MSALFNPTVAWITLRATLSRKRALLFALPAEIGRASCRERVCLAV